MGAPEMGGRAPQLSYDHAPIDLALDHIATVSRSDGVVIAHAIGGRRQVRIRGVPERAVTGYFALPAGSDPVLRRMLETRRPTHEREVVCEADWHALELYRSVARPHDLEHYMLAPLFGHGRIVGVVALCRSSRMPAFDTHDIATMCGLSAVVAMALSWALGRDREATRVLETLTRQQRQIAIYVAKGVLNSDIAEMLGVSVNTVKKHMKAIFHKLHVSRRAELAWVVTTGGLV